MNDYFSACTRLLVYLLFCSLIYACVIFFVQHFVSAEVVFKMLHKVELRLLYLLTLT